MSTPQANRLHTSMVTALGSVVQGSVPCAGDSFAQYLDASAHGWKTFAVVAKGKQSFSGKLCPATADNSQAQCITCSLCDGAKTDIFVEAHGSGGKYVTN